MAKKKIKMEDVDKAASRLQKALKTVDFIKNGGDDRVRDEFTASGVFEDFLLEDDVIDREVFNNFELIKTEYKMVFKSYTGFRLVVSSYAKGLDGTIGKTSLYEWLDNLISMRRRALEDPDSEFVEGSGATNQEIFDASERLTVANLFKPLAVFTDLEMAKVEAERYTDWLLHNMESLRNTMNSKVERDDVLGNMREQSAREAESIVMEMIPDETE